MDFKIDIDTWFIFTILFIGALGLFIIAYIVIPFITRRREINRIRSRQKKTHDKQMELDKKHSEDKMESLQKNNQKLQTDLRNDLKKILDANSKTPDLLSFYSNFEKVYPDFTESLQNAVTGITAHEIKLCALLRLNLSAKEISQLLNISPSSVNKARYRIRKKIGLSTGDDLFEFLLNI